MGRRVRPHYAQSAFKAQSAGIAIKQGQRVNFPNNDNIRQHVYSFSKIRQFSIELYADIPGEPITFDKAGIPGQQTVCNDHGATPLPANSLMAS